MMQKQVEERLMKKRSAQLVGKAYHEFLATAMAESEAVQQIYKQVTPTLAAHDDSIWAEVDLLEGDPVHRGVARSKSDSSHSDSRPKQTSGMASGRKAFSRDGSDLICRQMIVCSRVDQTLRHDRQGVQV